MASTLNACINDALNKMGKAELTKIWKEIYKRTPPSLDKETTIKQISSRIHDLDFPPASQYITTWLAEVYRTYSESRDTTSSPSLTDEASLLDVADILTQRMSGAKKTGQRNDP